MQKIKPYEGCAVIYLESPACYEALVGEVGVIMNVSNNMCTIHFTNCNEYYIVNHHERIWRTSIERVEVLHSSDERVTSLLVNQKITPEQYERMVEHEITSRRKNEKRPSAIKQKHQEFLRTLHRERYRGFKG